MISIKDKQDCCGCGACAARCPKQCITLQRDSEGFLYPQVDAQLCIECGLCEKVCPVLHQAPKEQHPRQTLAAVNRDESVRETSSSGGVFTLLAEKVLARGGVVFGARYDEQWQVVIDYTESIEGLAAFRGSKYVQARTADTFKQCEAFLKAGRQVLYSGTPCQIAGLHRFLRKSYPNLLAVDFICHGTPSPKVWSKYLDEVVAAGRQAVSDVQFRNKRLGWKKFSFYLETTPSGQVSICSPFGENPYMRAFLSDMSLRPSCYACPSKGGSSQSDLTIADFWGIEQVKPAFDDDRGTSLIVVHSQHGEEVIKALDMKAEEVSHEEALAMNSAYQKSVSPHPQRAAFFARLDSDESLCALIAEMLKLPFKMRVRRKLWKLKAVVKKVLNNEIGGGKIAHLPVNEPVVSVENPDALKPVYITFRNKKQGWRTYRLQIVLG